MALGKINSATPCRRLGWNMCRWIAPTQTFVVNCASTHHCHHCGTRRRYQTGGVLPQYLSIISVPPQHDSGRAPHFLPYRCYHGRQQLGMQLAHFVSNCGEHGVREATTETTYFRWRVGQHFSTRGLEGRSNKPSSWRDFPPLPAWEEGCGYAFCTGAVLFCCFSCYPRIALLPLFTTARATTLLALL